MTKIRPKKKVTIQDCRVNGIYTPEQCANKVAVKIDHFTTLLVDKNKLEAIGREAYVDQWMAKKRN